MRDFWRRVLREHDVSVAGLELLRRACECWDLAESARLKLADYGDTTFFDRFDQPKERPEVKTWRDNTTLSARLLRELQLDPPSDDSRPPRIY